MQPPTLMRQQVCARALPRFYLRAAERVDHRLPGARRCGIAAVAAFSVVGRRQMSTSWYTGTAVCRGGPAE